jgi:hypothetical protein
MATISVSRTNQDGTITYAVWDVEDPGPMPASIDLTRDIDGLVSDLDVVFDNDATRSYHVTRDIDGKITSIERV